MNPYVVVISAAVLIGAGGFTGYKVQEAAHRVQVEHCATDIGQGKTDRCPAMIQNAFGALGGEAARKEVEYRDRMVPVIVNGRSEDRQAREALAAQIEALNKVERTNACAAAPAFQLRRRQLLADAEAPDPAQPEADAASR